MKYLDIFIDKFRSRNFFGWRLILTATLTMAVVFLYKGNNGFFPPTESVDSLWQALVNGAATAFVMGLLGAVAFVSADMMGYEKEQILKDNTVNVYSMSREDFNRIVREAAEMRYITYEQMSEILRNKK